MRELTLVEMGSVAGGTKGCDPAPHHKGNNGWGNGADSTNPGSTKGGTAGSKKDNLWTAGDGPRPAKFTTR